MTFGSGDYCYELDEDWAKLPPGWSFIDIGGMAVDSRDRLFVFNRSPHPMIILNQDGRFAGSWGEGYFSRPHGTRITADDSIFCTDDVTHLVSKFTPEGRPLMSIGDKFRPSDTGYVEKRELQAALDTIVRGGPPFNRPTGIALNSAGEIYVSDGYGNARVHKFSATGKYLFSWGEPGREEGQFRLPHNVWIDREDRVWVSDRENSRLQVFDRDGKFLFLWDDLVRPTDVVIDEAGAVYVSELGHAVGVGPRVSIFGLDHELLARWGNEEKNPATDLFLAPHAIAVDSHGDIYVGEVAMTHSGFDRGARTVQKFVRQRRKALE